MLLTLLKKSSVSDVTDMFNMVQLANAQKLEKAAKQKAMKDAMAPPVVAKPVAAKPVAEQPVVEKPVAVQPAKFKGFVLPPNLGKPNSAYESYAAAPNVNAEAAFDLGFKMPAEDAGDLAERLARTRV